MNKVLSFFKNEEWVIVAAGTLILTLVALVPDFMPRVPKDFLQTDSLIKLTYMFGFLLGLVYLTSALLGKPVKGILFSFLMIFVIAASAQALAEFAPIKKLGLESVLFSVALGLIISNFFRVPEWLKPAVQSEFYIKIGLICLGSTILFSEIMKAGAFGLVQALVVVVSVWYFAYWLSRKMNVDREMSTMLASAVSICGVSAAIATCGAIKGDNKKLSYVISLVLVVAIPMMYLMPLIAKWMGLTPEVAGAWMGGTIDTTGAVVASGKVLGETAEKYSVIIKSSQNVLLGLAAFIISIYWSYQGKNEKRKPSARLLWDRFPKFVLGFIVASLVFSLFFSPEEAKSLGKISKGFSNTLFSVAFVCIGLETNFKELFTQENRKPLKAFLIAQGFNIIVTLIVAFLLFGILMNY